MFIAVRTGLEPATPGVTGPYSNQLNYRTNIFKTFLLLKTFATPLFSFGIAKVENIFYPANIFCIFLTAG